LKAGSLAEAHELVVDEAILDVVELVNVVHNFLTLFLYKVLDDDRSFIVLTETKFSFRCIPVWDRYSPHRTRVEKKNTCDNALTMTSPVHW
jgi:hypothetical protein